MGLLPAASPLAPAAARQYSCGRVGRGRRRALRPWCAQLRIPDEELLSQLDAIALQHAIERSPRDAESQGRASHIEPVLLQGLRDNLPLGLAPRHGSASTRLLSQLYAGFGRDGSRP